MTWLVPQLKERVQIGFPVQTANADGGADFSFDTLLTIWMSMKPVTFKESGSKYIRGEQVNEAITHEFSCRSIAVASLGKEFGLGFGDSFKFMASLVPLKSDYFSLLR